MRVAICCPGPSLASVPDLSSYDWRIGVNRTPAILRGVRFDAWSFDVRAFIDVFRTAPLDYKPLLFFSQRGEVKIAESARDDPDRRLWRWYASHGRLFWEDLRGYTFDDRRWMDLSMAAAVVLAVEHGAKQIDGYGMDWTNAPDADGRQLESCDRSEGRWARERERWAALENWTAENGIQLRRVMA